MKIWLLTGLMLAAALMSPHLDAEETNLEAFIAAQKLELLKAIHLYPGTSSAWFTAGFEELRTH